MIILDGGLGRQLSENGAPFRQPEWSALALMEAPHTVREVHDLTEEGPHVERDLALVKVISKARSHERRESLRIAEIFSAEPVDTTTNSFVFQMTGSPSKVDAFIDLMRELGKVEIVRSGSVAIARGAKSI
mgnify:CR=1 FL=1